MINLIPPQAHKVVKHEYWVRVFSSWAILLSFMLIALILLLVPTYVLVTSKIEAVGDEVARGLDSEADFKAAEDEVKQANKVIAQLNAKGPDLLPSQLLQAINEAASAEIAIQTYRIVYANQIPSDILVQGTADSRSALTNFRNELERSALFESASVPISDLARDSDLPFAIGISLAPIATQN